MSFANTVIKTFPFSNPEYTEVSLPLLYTSQTVLLLGRERGVDLEYTSLFSYTRKCKNTNLSFHLKIDQ